MLLTLGIELSVCVVFSMETVVVAGERRYSPPETIITTITTTATNIVARLAKADSNPSTYNYDNRKTFS